MKPDLDPGSVASELILLTTLSTAWKHTGKRSNCLKMEVSLLPHQQPDNRLRQIPIEGTGEKYITRAGDGLCMEKEGSDNVV